MERLRQFLGSLRKAKEKAGKKEIDYFEVSVNCENNMVPTVCYDLDCRPLLEKFNKESKSYCMLNAEISDDNVTILDYTIITKFASENKTFESQITSLMSVLQEIPSGSEYQCLAESTTCKKCPQLQKRRQN